MVESPEQRYARLKEMRQSAKVVNYCLPMTTKVLTEGGWKFYGDISVGDNLPVYDEITGSVVMGRVEDRHFYEGTEVYSYRNKDSGFSCTPNHKWLSKQRRVSGKERYYGSLEFTEAKDLNSESNVLLTAPYVGGTNVNVSEDEAFFMGLLLSDGSYYWSKSLGGKSNSGGKKRYLKMMVGQSKNKYYKEVEESLETLGLTHSKGVVEKDNGNTVYIYAVHSAPARALLDKVMNERLDRDDYNWTSWVVSLSRVALEAFYKGFYLGDGNTKGDDLGISQNEGSVADGIVAATQLIGEGRVTYKGNDKCKFIRQHRTKHLTWQRIVQNKLPDQDTFCLTTTGSSFIIWQEDSIGITGNSSLYGVGAATLSRQGGFTKKEATDLLKSFWEMNWAIKKVSSKVFTKKTKDNKMWLKNPVSGFWYSLRNDRDVYSTLNQGTGVYCFDKMISNVRDTGIKFNFQAHDEGAYHIKRGTEEANDTLLKACVDKLNDQLKLNVPLAIDAQYGPTYGSVH